MYRKVLILVSIGLFALSLNGCLVAESKYMKKVEEASNLTKELQALQQKYVDLTKENADLKNQVQALTKERNELDKVLKAKSDDLSKSITELRQKTADLEAENSKLKQNIAELQKKEAAVQAESETYKQLMQEMKSEVAKGQITISELKGKLTLDVANQILFASGEADVKKEGKEVLKRVVDILKNVKDKAIRVEGHTDNKKIYGRLVRVYPTNWELSAARAINVVKYLQQQGIDPQIISAVAYGEYKPLADNSTEEGQAKNRRIGIILLPKD